jgi:hypothetical protein
MQTEWPAQEAIFTVVDTTDNSGVRQVTLIGSVDEALYFQPDSETPCTVNWGTTASGPSEFQLAFLLSPVTTAKFQEEQDMDGIATRHYTFDAASLSLADDITANGEIWIANDGGYVVKYVLDISGAESYFGPGAQGTQHMEYLLSEVGTNPEVVYPNGCKPVLDLPAMDDATDLIRLPELLGYNTNGTAEVIFAFYEEKLIPLGWEKLSEGDPGTDLASMSFVRTDIEASAIIAVETEGNSRRVTVMASNPESAATVPKPTTVVNPSVRVGTSLTILFGNDPSQPTLPSYHLEANNQTPTWDGSKIIQSQEVMSADVQGKDVHFTYRTTKTTEAYLIGDQEYAVVNGQVQPPGFGMANLTWTMWQLDPVTILGVGIMGTTATGTDTLEERTVEVYELNGASATLEGVGGIGLPITSVTGTVWVDQQTGALLKADLDYTADVKDTSGNTKGNGSGHLEITITLIGNVTVSLP